MCLTARTWTDRQIRDTAFYSKGFLLCGHWIQHSVAGSEKDLLWDVGSNLQFLLSLELITASKWQIGKTTKTIVKYLSLPLLFPTPQNTFLSVPNKWKEKFYIYIHLGKSVLLLTSLIPYKLKSILSTSQNLKGGPIRISLKKCVQFMEKHMFLLLRDLSKWTNSRFCG